MERSFRRSSDEGNRQAHFARLQRGRRVLFTGEDMEALEPDLVEVLFRFAFLLSGQRALAVEMVCTVVAEAEARSAHWREGDHRFHWALHRVWSQWSDKKLPHPEPSEEGLQSEPIEGLNAFLQCLDPQPRACAAIDLACSLPLLAEGVVARLLSDKTRTVRRWRKERESLLTSGQSWASWRDAIGQWLLTDAEREKLQSAVKVAPPVRHRFERFLGWAAVLTGALALGGWLGWERLQDSEPSRVQTNLEQLLEVADGWKNVEWKTFEGHPGEVEDWLFLNGLEGAHFPARLAKIPATAGRVVQWHDARVAQVIASQPKSLIWIVPAQAAGVLSQDLRSGSVRSGRWSGNWTLEGAYLVLVAAVVPSS